MCNKTTTSGLKPNTMINKRTKKALKPPRRARTKTKKPKFLSLRLQLSSEKTQQQSTEMPSSTTSSATNHRQLNLFPLHPENSTEEKDTHDENMAYFFSATDGGATTLTGLLGSSTTSSSDEDNVTNNTNNCTRLSSSVSLSYAYGAQDSEEGALVRTALKRNKERDASEERWVCYSEVVERKSDEEVTSCAVDDQRKLQSLALKLDYQEIMNAWSDRGPLYIHADSPQIVPDMHDDFLAHESSNGLRDCWGSNIGVWTVPEMKTNESNGGIRCEKEGQVGEELKLAQREASVLRYKEKRQNRLFAKKIRYEVRKLNAEKRPRVKGRFVKRS